MNTRPAILALLRVANSLTFTPRGEAQGGGVGNVEIHLMRLGANIDPTLHREGAA